MTPPHDARSKLTSLKGKGSNREHRIFVERPLSGGKAVGLDAPGFIHRGWDSRDVQDIPRDDTVIFANGTEADPMPRLTNRDLDERWPRSG